ncbi:MAG TPA: outer membrane protein assembly factor BamD [Micropepsaceae bacterium]|nr:outer membrane protein assembly factor BamD [Micropepsaceae bacterium]HRK72298.1 outer membrane protein assembly factor BamD [Micropepsaceae bacterium]
MFSVLAKFGRVALVAVMAGTALTLSGCGSDDVEEIEYIERPVELLYEDALKFFRREDYRSAAPLFEEVERQHPYSVWARRAILMSAFCYYELNKYSQVILAADRFIALHPGNKDVAYAYYIKAVSYYEQISDVGRDQKTTQQALVALNDVVQRFPNTAYARDARLKIDLTLDHLAGKEMSVGRYYLKREQYVAAINRFKAVLDAYQTTSQVPEALHRLVEAYMALGIVPEAQKYAAVLGHNFPGSEWYEATYALMTDANLAPATEVDDDILGDIWGFFF